MRTSGSASKGNKGDSCGGGGDGTVVSAKGNNNLPHRRRRRLLVKIILAISIFYQVVWITNQISKFSIAVTDDIDADVPTELKQQRFGSSSDGMHFNVGGGNENHRASSTSSYAVKQSPFRSLPSHPFPNAELQALVASPSTTTNNHTAHTCPNGLIYVTDQIATLPDSSPNRRLIPKILHFTTKSRCMTPAFASNIQLWKNRLGSEYSIYIHDDDAMNKFIYQRIWTEFPELKEVMACVTAGAAKADIWRYLMIWEYGGIYSDIDCSPSDNFSASFIRDDDDAFFPLEALGIPAQYFFAASPRHPVMYLSAKHALQRISFRDNISVNNAAKTTGPGAFKAGFILFQELAGFSSTGYVTEGIYPGAYGRSVRVVGSKELPREYILREGIRGDKRQDYVKMGMTHFQNTQERYNELGNNHNVLGCLEVRYKMHVDGTADWVNIV